MEIRKLNMLRGIAALMVVVSHYSNDTRILHGVLGAGGGKFGVMLFFILSGFLMSYLYMAKENNKVNIHNFAVARFARVIPLFAIVVVVSYVLQLSGIKGVFYNIQDMASFLSHFMLLYGDNVLWTIAPEIQFYILFVFLWWLKAKHIGYLYLVFAFVFLVLVFFDFPHPKGKMLGLTIEVQLFRSLPFFFVGVIFGQIYKNWKCPQQLSSGFFILSLLIIPLLYPKIFQLLTGFNYKMWADIGVLFIVSFVFFLVVFLTPEENIFHSNPIGDFVGKISYSLYFIHNPILRLIKDSAKEQPEVFFIIFIGASLIISYISYLVIENPLRKAIRSICTVSDKSRAKKVLVQDAYLIPD